MENKQKSIPDKIESAIRILQKNLHEGWLYFCICDELRFRYKSDNYLFGLYDRFFNGIFDACLRTSILVLAELLLKSKNAINLQYLLNLARDSSSQFQYVQKAELLSNVKQHEDWLENLKQQGFTPNLGGKRNKTLAHTDRKFAIEKASDFIRKNPPLDVEIIREVFHKLHQVISTYERYFYGSSGNIGFVDVEPEVKNEIARLFQHLR